MDILDVLKSRESIRKFENRKIEDEIVNKIIEAGRVSPTACNLQPQRILVIKSDEGLEKWRKCTHSHFNEQLVLIVCYEKNGCWVREYDKKPSGDIDASIVTTQMMLEAHSLGIGSTWVMHFNPETLKTEFNVPDFYEPVAVLSLGYPASDHPKSNGHNNKKDLSKTVFFEKFN